MPAAKNTALRYRFINQCLASKAKRYWSRADLIAFLERKDIIINNRTLDYDINSMRHDERLGFRAPIAYCKINRGYYYTNPAFSIEKLQLDSKDLKAISFAAATLKQFKGVGPIGDFEGTLDKIIQVVDHLKDDLKLNNQRIIEFERAPYGKGVEYVNVIWEAIRDKQVLNISYTKHRSKPSPDRIFHPYLLKEFRNRFYVLGWQEEKKTIITLGLDRIDKIRNVNKRYIENTMLNPEEYFYHTLGITHAGGKVEEIILHCSPFLTDYIRTQPLHHTQVILKEDAHVTQVRLRLTLNPELVSLILSYADDIEVIAPATLRQQVGEKLKRMWSKYF